MKRLLLLSLALLLLTGGRAWSYGSSDKGTSGAAFLKIGPGARPAAMGEAYAAVEGDAQAVYYNPAGLAAVPGWDLTGMHNQYFQGLSYEFAAAAAPVSRLIGAEPQRDLGVAALGVTSLSAGEMDRRGLTDAGGPTGTFGATDMAFSAAYARRFDGKLSLGGALKFIHQSLDDKSASAVAVDLGAHYRLDPRWSLGGGLRHAGSSPKLGSVADPLPMTVFLGGAFQPREDLLFALDLGFPRDRDVLYGVGAEYVRKLTESARGAFRMGYSARSADAEGLGGLTMGMGLGYKSFDFDFAWVPMGDLGSTFRYSFRLRY
ncbi:MAG TPA: hypothetical protein DCM05_16815 [Elusimicrobia bacterium]|nr:hypothetical protein [Elusimicrobiota bacterium]